MITDGQSAVLQGYINSVLDGEQVVSKAVRSAVDRHVRDLSRQSTQDFPYHFDSVHAAKVCRFFPTMLRHSIGRYADMPFDLAPWQVFCTSMLFGWLRDVDNTRRFRRDYRSMGRKNGKSTWIAGESIYQAGFDKNPITGKVESVAQVVLAATKKDQVQRVIFAEAARMRERSPLVAAKSIKLYSEIKFPANEGEMIVVGSDRPFSGLNPHAVKLDEVHEYREFHRKFYDTMLTGSAARDQPLISIITTAGDDTSYLWKEVYQYASDVASGVVVDDSFFAFICELDKDDDPFDEANWIKANPNLGVSVPLDYLRLQATEGKSSKAGESRLVQYHCNRIVSSTNQAFDMNQWDACEGVLSDWSEADSVCAGVDLGGRNDLAAYGLVARFPHSETEDGNPVWRYEAKAFTFIAEDTQRNLTQQPFATWKYLDILKVRKFPTVELYRSLVEQCLLYGVNEIGYDALNGQTLGEELEQEGFVAASIRQNCSNFNEPITDLLSTIREGRFRHDGNEVLRWCVNNAVVRKNYQDEVMFDKPSSKEKIDAIVAVTMAFRMATRIKARATGKLFIG